MKKTAILLTALWLLAAVPQARAQYYNTGQSPASLRWKSIGNDSLQVVFPDGFGKQAHRTLFYMTPSGAASATDIPCLRSKHPS